MAEFWVTLRNREGQKFKVKDDQAIIDAAEEAGHILPIACRYGGCITCAAKMIEGDVRQPGGTAINKRQSQAGYVLLCVARPKADCVFDVGVESHDKLYQNPFAVAKISQPSTNDKAGSSVRSYVPKVPGK